MALRFSPTKSEVVHFWRDIKGSRIRKYPVFKLKGEKKTQKRIGQVAENDSR